MATSAIAANTTIEIIATVMRFRPNLFAVRMSSIAGTEARPVKRCGVAGRVSSAG